MQKGKQVKSYQLQVKPVFFLGLFGLALPLLFLPLQLLFGGPLFFDGLSEGLVLFVVLGEGGLFLDHE
jgi:hypothetical protein